MGFWNHKDIQLSWLSVKKNNKTSLLKRKLDKTASTDAIYLN